MKLYVSTKENALWFAVGNYHCVKCKEPINSCVASIKWEQKKETDILLFCHHCIKYRDKNPYNHFEKKGVLLSLLPVLIKEERPRNVRVWVPFPPEFTYGRLNLFEAADPRFDNKMNSDTSAYQIEDKTVYAGRESWEGASIGVVDKSLLEEKDRSIRSDDDAFLLLKNLQASSEALEHKEKKLLEDKEV